MGNEAPKDNQEQDVSPEEIQAQLIIDLTALKRVLVSKGVITQDELKIASDAVVEEMSKAADAEAGQE